MIHAAEVSSVEVYKKGAAQTDILDRNATPISTEGHKRPHVDLKVANFLDEVNSRDVSKVVDEDKEKIQVLFEQHQRNPGDVPYLDLDSARSISQNFVNPQTEKPDMEGAGLFIEPRAIVAFV